MYAFSIGILYLPLSSGRVPPKLLLLHSRKRIEGNVVGIQSAAELLHLCESLFNTSKVELLQRLVPESIHGCLSFRRVHEGVETRV